MAQATRYHCIRNCLSLPDSPRRSSFFSIVSGLPFLSGNCDRTCWFSRFYSAGPPLIGAYCTLILGHDDAILLPFLSAPLSFQLARLGRDKSSCWILGCSSSHFPSRRARRWHTWVLFKKNFPLFPSDSLAPVGERFPRYLRRPRSSAAPPSSPVNPTFLFDGYLPFHATRSRGCPPPSQVPVSNADRRFLLAGPHSPSSRILSYATFCRFASLRPPPRPLPRAFHPLTK